MVTEETCVGPFYCTALTGECCEVYLSNGIITCPVRGCTDDINRQSDVAGSQRFSIRDIFSTTLVTTLMYEVLKNIGAATTTTTTTTTISTTTTTTAAPIITSSKHDQFYFIVNVFSISISVTGTSGTFNSVNYPSNYFDDYEEHFIISVETFSRIFLYFDFYNLEYHVGCIYDYTEGRILYF